MSNFNTSKGGHFFPGRGGKCAPSPDFPRGRSAPFPLWMDPPSPNLVSDELIERLVQAVPGLVVVDYYENDPRGLPAGRGSPFQPGSTTLTPTPPFERSGTIRVSTCGGGGGGGEGLAQGPDRKAPTPTPRPTPKPRSPHDVYSYCICAYPPICALTPGCRTPDAPPPPGCSREDGSARHPIHSQRHYGRSLTVWVPLSFLRPTGQSCGV